MSILLREATLDDVERIIDVHFSAFGTETVSLQTLPRASGTGRAFWKPSIVEAIQGKKHTHVLVVTDDDAAAASDQIIAFAKWRAPGAPIVDPPPASAWPQDGNPELGARFFGRFAEVHREIMGEKPHWYLELVCTHRSANGRGAARRLLEWGLGRADEEGREVYLEATEEAEGIYKGKFGFEVVRREDIDIGKEVIDAPFMVRQPVRAGESQ